MFLFLTCPETKLPFLRALRSCADSKIAPFPSKTHARAIKAGADTSVWNKILTAYSKSSGVADAGRLFDEIPHRDTVSWNSLIAGYVSNGRYRDAWRTLKTILEKSLDFDQYTLGAILKSVAASVDGVDLGFQLHCLILKTGLDRNVFSGSALVDVYSKCGRIRDAYAVFLAMPERNTVSWNAIITGYSLLGDVRFAFALFVQMEREGLSPDEATFARVLTLVTQPSLSRLMSQVHGKIVKYDWVVDAIVYNAAIVAYSQCGLIEESVRVFEDMDGIRDLVTWNSMLASYAFHGLTKHAIRLFIRIHELGIDQDMYTFTSVISACFEHGQQDQGKILHGLVVKKGLECATPVSNALITMYIRCSDNSEMEDAMRCFSLMGFRDNVSWNSIITGLSQNSLSEEALKFFCHMQSVYPMVDQYALSATLRACSDLAVLQFGRGVHCLVLKSGFILNDFVVSSMIYMYSKCGIIEDARRSFDEANKDSSVSWNSIIFGYAQHGQGQIALSIFSEMLAIGVEPDHITFVGLLSACSHIGLVEEGSMILKSMESLYGIPLRMEHYACGVDLFGRAGRLDEAIELIKSMPFEPDSMVWMTLLGACRVRGNLELASHVASHLLVIEPREHSTYVLLSNMYAGSGMWDNRATIQKVMKNRGLSKIPGRSWIEVKNKVHSFNAEDRSHSQAGEIYEIVRALTEAIEVTDDDHAVESGMDCL